MDKESKLISGVARVWIQAFFFFFFFDYRMWALNHIFKKGVIDNEGI